MPLVRQVFTRTRQLTSAIKDVGRLREIVGILFNHGFGYLLENSNIPGTAKIKARRDADGSSLSAPQRMLAVITELGPTYVKVGQILSTRPDLIPEEFIDAFQTLQDQVAPLPFDDIRVQIETSLGKTLEDLFEEVEPEPLASASIAQVHRARLKTGEAVVLKVQRPGVRVTILRDLEILTFLAKQIEYNFPEARLFDLTGIVKEIERSIRAETNFLVEASNMQRFYQNFAGNSTVHFPTLYRDFTTSEVITMEYLDGIKITRAKDLGRDMVTIGKRYLDAAYQMLFQDGFFHGDLHPGNVVVMEGDVLGFLDFGMVGRLTPDMKDNVVESVFSLLNLDFRMIVKIFWEIGIKDESVSYQRFEADLIEVMERHLVGKEIAELQMGLFFKDILEGAVRHRIRTPPGYTMLFKALVTTEGMAKMLVPTINPLEISRPYIETLVRDRYSPERLNKEYFYYLSAFARLAQRLPTAIGQLVTDIEERRLKMTSEVTLTPVLREEWKRIEERRLLTAVAMGTLIAGTMAFPHGHPVLLGLPSITLICYTVCSILLLLLALGYPRRR